MLNMVMLANITNALQMEPNALLVKVDSVGLRVPTSKREASRVVWVDVTVATRMTRTASHKTIHEEV